MEPDSPLINVRARAVVRRPLILGLIVLAATFIAWIGVLYINFLADDYGFTPAFVLQPDEIREALRRTQAGLRILHPFRPTLFASMYLDYLIYGFDPVGYHLTSLIIHSLNALLLFLVVRILSRNDLMAFVAALFFGLYAGHVEAVGWISARCDSLAGFWLLLSILAFLVSRWQKRELPLILLSVVFLILALFSKEVVIAAVPVLAVIAAMGRGEKVARITWWILGTLAVAGFILFRIWMFGSLSGDTFATRATASAHMLPVDLLSNLGQDLRMMISPFNRFEFPLGEWIFFGLFGVVLILALYALLMNRRKRLSLLLPGIIWILSFLAPSLAIGSVDESMNDCRFLYLPSMGLALVISPAIFLKGGIRPVAWTFIALLLGINLFAASHNTGMYIGISEKARIVDRTVVNEVLYKEKNQREDAIIVVVNIPRIYKGVHFGPTLYRPYLDYLLRLNVEDVIFTEKDPEDIPAWHEDLQNSDQFFIVFVFDPETDRIEPLQAG